MRELQSSEAANQFVAGLIFPIAKADVLREAKKAKLSDTIVRQLDKIPEREYASAEDLTAALNAA